MNTINILWIDDEIDLLKPHIIFLEKRNYKVTTCTSGSEALDVLDDMKFDCVITNPPYNGLRGEGGNLKSLDIYPEFIEKAYIVGNASSISEKVIDKLSKYEPERIDGTDKYDRNLKIINQSK